MAAINVNGFGLMLLRLRIMDKAWRARLRTKQGWMRTQSIR